MTRVVVWIVSVGLMVLGASVVSGQDYPNRPIRIVAGSVGSGNDFAARIIAPGISGPLGQPVIVENRGGGGSFIAETVAKAAPDGYTLVIVGSTFWVAPLIQKLPYDPVRDFSPITLATRSPNLLVVHPSVPVKSVRELIALAKAKPGELNYSHGSIGASGHIAGELFKAMAGVKMQGVSYKSDSQQLAELLAGIMQLTFEGGEKVNPYIKLGKLRALAVTSAQPSALAPGLPTVAASGLPGYESLSIIGMLAPAGTPVMLINRLNQEIVRVLNRADLKEKLFNTGVEAVGSSPEEFANKIKSEMTTLGKVIKDAGIKAQ